MPNLNVAGFWDQEDPWGPWEIYRRSEQSDPNRYNFMVAGPWFHGQWHNPQAESIGQMSFGGHDTAVEFREKIEAPWFRYWLHGKGEKFPWKASTFQTGSNSWQTYAAWPPKATATNSTCSANGTLVVRSAACRRQLRAVHLGSGQPGAVPAAADLADLSGRRLAPMGSRGSALRGRPSRRGDLGQRSRSIAT